MSIHALIGVTTRFESNINETPLPRGRDVTPLPTLPLYLVHVGYCVCYSRTRVPFICYSSEGASERCVRFSYGPTSIGRRPRHPHERVSKRLPHLYFQTMAKTPAKTPAKTKTRVKGAVAKTRAKTRFKGNSRPTIPEWVTGVHVSKGKFRAQIRTGERTMFIGRFPTWQEAARAFDAVAKVARGA